MSVVYGAAEDGFAYVLEVNTTTWAVTTASATLEFDTLAAYSPRCVAIDANHFFVFWSGTTSAIATVQVFAVNTTTWAVTTAAALLQFEGIGGQGSCAIVDSNHAIFFWRAIDNDGFAQVFAVNTSTWAVTTAAASLEFDTQYGSYHSCFQIDTNHFINFWTGVDNDGYVQVFTVNTTTWAVTTAANRLEFDTVNGTYNSCCQVDANHFINFWAGDASDGYVQVFTVNTTTWAVTTAAARLDFDETTVTYNSCYKIDTNHFVNTWSGSGEDGFVQVFTVNTSTWGVTTAAATLEFDTINAYNLATLPLDTTHFLNVWGGGATFDAEAQVFTVALPVVVDGLSLVQLRADVRGIRCLIFGWTLTPR